MQRSLTSQTILTPGDSLSSSSGNMHNEDKMSMCEMKKSSPVIGVKAENPRTIHLGVPGSVWIPEMDQTLIRMFREGHTYPEIGKKIGQSDIQVFGRVRVLRAKGVDLPFRGKSQRRLSREEIKTRHATLRVARSFQEAALTLGLTPRGLEEFIGAHGSGGALLPAKGQVDRHARNQEICRLHFKLCVSVEDLAEQFEMSEANIKVILKEPGRWGGEQP